jgi:hypothetical protein
MVSGRDSTRVPLSDGFLSVTVGGTVSVTPVSLSVTVISAVFVADRGGVPLSVTVKITESLPMNPSAGFQENKEEAVWNQLLVPGNNRVGLILVRVGYFNKERTRYVRIFSVRAPLIVKFRPGIRFASVNNI